MRINDWSSVVFCSDLNGTIVVCASTSDNFKKGNKWRETSLGGMARPRGQGSMPTGGNGGGKSTPQNDKACAALNKRVEDARNYLPPRLTNTSAWDNRSEEHTSELQSLMSISYAVFCLNTKHECLYKDGMSATATLTGGGENGTAVQQ